MIVCRLRVIGHVLYELVLRDNNNYDDYTKEKDKSNKNIPK